MQTCESQPITIFRGDDTDGLGYQSIKGKITTVLDLTGCKAVFRYLGFTQTIDPIPEDKRFTITIPSDITARFPPGMGFASLRVYDQTGKVRTFTNRIPVFVTMTAPAVVEGDFTVKFYGGTLDLEPLKIWTKDGFVDYDGYVERIIDKATADRFGLTMLKDTFGPGDDADSGIAATPKSVNAAYAAILGELTDNYYNKDTVDQKIEDAKPEGYDDLKQRVSDIEDVIPEGASDENQLADKEWTDTQIDRLAAYYITSDAQGNAFQTYASLVQEGRTYYSGGVARTPTRNDYAVVLADETHDGAEWRYIYATNGGSGQWEAQYPIETNDYTGLSNKPSINGVTLSGNKTSAELGLASPSDAKPVIAGDADAGSSDDCSRSDHVHPAETEVVAYRLPDNCFPITYEDITLPSGQQSCTIASNDGIRFEFDSTQNVIILHDIASESAGGYEYGFSTFSPSTLKWRSDDAVIENLKYNNTVPTLHTWPVLENDAVFVREVRVAKPSDIHVTSVNGKTGAVQLNASDVDALGNSGAQTLDGTLAIKDQTSGKNVFRGGTGGDLYVDTYLANELQCRVQFPTGGGDLGKMALKSEVPTSASDIGALGNNGNQTLNGNLTANNIDAQRVELFDDGLDAIGLDGNGLRNPNNDNVVISWPSLISSDTLALVSQIYTAVQQIAPDFTAKAYALNELCSYNGVVYRCKSAYTASAQSTKPNADTTHWEAKKVSELFLPLTGGTMSGGLSVIDTDKTDSAALLKVGNDADNWTGLCAEALLHKSGNSFGYCHIPLADGTLALLADMYAAVQQIAPAFDPNRTLSNRYKKYDLCSKDGIVYQCTNQSGHYGSWHQANWTAKKVSELFLPLTGGTIVGGVTFNEFSGGKLFVDKIYSPGEGEWTLPYGKTGTVALTSDIPSIAGLAPIASPAFTGTPTAPTPTAGDDSTKVATTAFVQGALRYTIGAAQTISTASQDSSGGTTIDYGTTTLADRTVNQVAVTASLDELRISFPAAVSGKVRDFELRLEIGTGSAALTAPAIVIVPPTGETITLENADGTWPTLEDGTATAKGVTSLYFSESATGKFLVKGEAMKEVA